MEACSNYFWHNDPAGKVLLTSENDIFGGHLTPPKYKIIDCGAFCEVIFFCISPKNLLGDFFYSLNEEAHREPVFRAIRWSRLLAILRVLLLLQFRFDLVFAPFLGQTYHRRGVNLLHVPSLQANASLDQGKTCQCPY